MKHNTEAAHTSPAVRAAALFIALTYISCLGKYNDYRSDSPIIEGHIVNYLKIYVEWGGYDY